MTAISKEQWEKLEEEISSMWVNVRFEYKGHELSIQRQRESESKTVLVVYIDDCYASVWGFFKEECEDRPGIICDVWKRATKAYYSPKHVKEIEKILGKRRAKKDFPDLHARQEYYLPYFSKASVLCRQFRKLDGLKLIKADCLEPEASV